MLHVEAIGNDTASCILQVGCWAIPCHSRWTFIEHRLDNSRHRFEKAQRFHGATRGDILSIEVGMNSLSSPPKSGCTAAQWHPAASVTEQSLRKASPCPWLKRPLLAWFGDSGARSCEGLDTGDRTPWQPQNSW